MGHEIPRTPECVDSIKWLSIPGLIKAPPGRKLYCKVFPLWRGRQYSLGLSDSYESVVFKEIKKSLKE